MSDFFNTQKIKKTRKEHTCDCCKSIIQKGEEMIRYAGVYEGDFFTSKLCPQCDKIIEIYCDKYETNEWCMNEVLGEVWSLPEVQKLFKEMKHPSDFVKSCIEEYKELEEERRINNDN